MGYMLISKEFYIKVAKLNKTNCRRRIQISLIRNVITVKIFIYKAGKMMLLLLFPIKKKNPPHKCK